MYGESNQTAGSIGVPSLKVSAIETSINQLRQSQEELHVCISTLEERLDVVLSPLPPPTPEGEAKEHLCGAPLWRSIEERTQSGRSAISRISRIIERLAI